MSSEKEGPEMKTIPYARAEIRGDRYGVICPECGEFFADVDETQDTAEDAITKGSARRYALHYDEAH